MPVPLGDLLVTEELITRQQLHAAMSHQRVNGGELGGALVQLGFVRDDDITALLSRTFRVPSINLSRFEIDDGVIELIPPATARKYQVVPLGRSGATLTVAMTDPTNMFAMDDIKFMTGYNVEPVVASDVAVAGAIQKYYANVDEAVATGPSTLEIATRELADMPHLYDDDVKVFDDLEEVDTVNLQRQGGEAPVVRLVNVLLASAIHKGASDVHVESYEKEFRIRFRIDGMLYTVMTPPLKMREAVTSRLKIMAKLNIAEKRLPQDGRIRMRFRDQGATREIDLRVSSLPTLFGEKLVLRLLDRDRLTLDMTKLGFEEHALERFEASIRSPWGMVLVTGPTGSGKTNTL